jgi:sulfite exporter TauE/SafE
MPYALALTSLAMGLAGGPHCTAMCGAACAGFTGASRDRPMSPWLFQAGRLAGYATAGAMAGQGMAGVAALASHVTALQPVLVMLHAAVLAWGLMLLVLARQPVWATDAGRLVWAKVRPLAGTSGGLLAAGMLWALMPCGLLYSALLVAALGGNAANGALSMALFAAGSGLWLLAAPRLLRTMRQAANRIREDMGTRISGGLLAGTAAFALWVDVAHRIAQWCAVG